MAGLKLTKTSLTAGVWQGVLTGQTGGPPQGIPALCVTHQSTELAGIEVVPFGVNAAGVSQADVGLGAVSSANASFANASSADVSSAGGRWTVRVPIPADLISDGVQSFVISDATTGTTLSSFAIIAGDALAEDIRAEMDLLRAELDLLKRAFRRHCVETA